jgi:tRNA(Ile)-lysidine synthase
VVTRKSPPTLTTLVRRALLGECGVVRGDSLLVAVSGGADSTALLHALFLASLKLELRLVACGVNHNLRPEAQAELELVAQLAAKLDVPFELVQVKVSPGGNLQARAREQRYAALRELKTRLGLRWLATAHHADDRAETVLMRVLRGAPPEGLYVLPPRSADLIRPMLSARRSDVLAHLARHQLTWAEDPSNGDERFLRVRIRREVLPLLTELSPNIVAHLNTLADELGGEPLPSVTDEAGNEVRLGQAQRQALRQALRDRSARARVLIKGTRTLRLNRNGEAPGPLTLVEPAGKSSKLRAKKPKKGQM